MNHYDVPPSSSTDQMPIPDVPIGPLNDNYKFFLANVAYALSPQAVKQWFTRFGTVNHVKIIYDKHGKSKGFGFLYMQTAEGSHAVEEFSKAGGGKITMMGRENVHCTRHDEGRVKEMGFGTEKADRKGEFGGRGGRGGKGRGAHVSGNETGSGYASKGMSHYGPAAIIAAPAPVPTYNIPPLQQQNQYEYVPAPAPVVPPPPAHQQHVLQVQQQQSYANPSPGLFYGAPAAAPAASNSGYAGVSNSGYGSYQQPLQSQYDYSPYGTIPENPPYGKFQTTTDTSTVTSTSQMASVYGNQHPQQSVTHNQVQHGGPSPPQQQLQGAVGAVGSYQLPQYQGFDPITGAYVQQQQPNPEGNYSNGKTQQSYPPTQQQHGTSIVQPSYQPPTATQTATHMQQNLHQGAAPAYPPAATTSVGGSVYALASQQPYSLQGMNGGGLAPSLSSHQQPLQHQPYISYQPQQQQHPSMSHTVTTMAVPIPPPPPPLNSMATTKVLLQNLPSTIQPSDIVTTLVQNYSKTPRRCTLEHPPYDASQCFAHVDFHSIADATEIMNLANRSQLFFRGRILTAIVDWNPAPDGVSTGHIAGYISNSNTHHKGAPASYSNFKGKGGRGRGGGKFLSGERDARRDRPY